jgi:hypothetical protein
MTTTIILTLLLFMFINILLDPGPYPRKYNPQLKVIYKDTDHIQPLNVTLPSGPTKCTKTKRSTNKRYPTNSLTHDTIDAIVNLQPSEVTTT